MPDRDPVISPADAAVQAPLGEAPLPSTPAPAVSPPADVPAEIADVWSWPPRYRRRARLLLLVNLALFSGLCVFTHWLHMGVALDFSLESYVLPLRIWSGPTQSLQGFVLYPISVVQTPVHGVVIGLLISSIVAVPISVAILYRFASALPFCAAVFVFAHLPWMAVTLLASCVLASLPPFRMRFRFGSALVGLLPVLVYLYLATRGPDALGASVSPEEKLLLTGPWVLAILGASTMLAVILLIARLVRFRPGAVAPVMAVMFVTPAVLFHRYVGADELNYRVLEREYGPRSRHFEPVQDARDRILEFVHQRTERGTETAAQRAIVEALWSEQPAEQLAGLKHRISNHLLLELLERREAAYYAAADFIADHPQSRFVPCALFVQARALDTRLDELRFSGAGAQRELYTDFPHVQSEPAWTNLLTQYPASPLAVAARLRVAQLRLRRGDTSGALGVLTPEPDAPDVADSQPVPRPLLSARPPEASLGFDPEAYQFEAQRLRELILANRDDPRYGDAPLHELAALDAHRRGYAVQLLRLAHRCAAGRLHDNVLVRWAGAQPDRRARMAALSACIERFPDGDALPEALFNLADLEVQGPRGADPTLRAGGIERFRMIVERFPGSCWARLARERLRTFDPQAVAGGEAP